MSDPLVDIIEKALYGYVKPYQAVHVARKVVRLIADPANREAVLRELGYEQVGWLDPRHGSLLPVRWRGGGSPSSTHLYEPVYRWAEPPRQPAPSPPGELCGAWDMGDGGCTMPKGHNMGKVDIPENHAFPRQPAPSIQEPEHG